MGRYEPIVIERDGGHYNIRQGADFLFRMPVDIFEAFEGDSVFPPLWTRIGTGKGQPEPRYLLWHPLTSELLMSEIRQRPPLLAEVFGNHPFRSYLQIFWIPEHNRLVMRTFWNPRAPSESFDIPARRENYRVQRAFLRMIFRLRPPSGLIATLNVVDRFQRLAGLEGTQLPADPPKILKIHLPPTAKLNVRETTSALEALAVEMAGRCYPSVDAENFICLEALTESDMEDAEDILDRFGIQYADEPFKSH